MVFRFTTVDFTQDFNTTIPYSPPSSPESTVCNPLGDSRTRSFGVRVKAGVSQLFAATRPDPANLQGRKNKKKKNNNKNKSRELQDAAAEGLCIDTDSPDRKQLRKFTYKELKEATDNFSEKNVLGQGGYGRVYKGRLSPGLQVAVKRMERQSGQGVAEFRAEVEVGRLVMHRNVVPLIGFCEVKKPEELLLVYPLMPNGSLPSHLYQRPESQPPLDWDTRKRIALGVARGLSYLHDHCSLRIIHRDMKPSNILLDVNLEPRIGDFGLARFMDHKQDVARLPGEPFPDDDQSESETTDRICGTYGYMAPEFAMEGKYSPKTDVFAYGMALLELISGRSNSSLRKLGPQPDWVKRLVDTGNLESNMVDSSIRSDPCIRIEEAERLIKLSLICTHSHSPAQRPNMSEVIGILEGSYGSLDWRWEEFR